MVRRLRWQSLPFLHGFCFLLGSPVCITLLITCYLNSRQSPVSAMSAAFTWTGCTLASTVSSLAVSRRSTSMTMLSQSGTTWVRLPPTGDWNRHRLCEPACYLPKRPTMMEWSFWNWTQVAGTICLKLFKLVLNFSKGFSWFPVRWVHERLAELCRCQVYSVSVGGVRG